MESLLFVRLWFLQASSISNHNIQYQINTPPIIQFNTLEPLTTNCKRFSWSSTHTHHSLLTATVFQGPTTPYLLLNFNDPPFSSHPLILSFGGWDELNPLAMTDPGLPSLTFTTLVCSEFLSAEPDCSNNSMRFKEGTSPLQYLRHIFLYVDSRPRMKFDPSQTGDLDMSSRRLILKFCNAGMSDANFMANLTYSSSFLATKFSRPEMLKVRYSVSEIEGD